MKKYLFAIVLFLVCHLGYAQNVNTIFNEFKNEANAEYVTISPFLMLIGKVFVHGEGSEIVTKIKSIKVLDLEDCDSQIRERFNKRMSSFDTDRYETLIRVNDSGEKVHILARQKKDYISELLIICTDKEDCTLIQINGKIGRKDIDKLVAEQTNKNNGCR